MKATSEAFRLFTPLLCASALYATSFSGAPSGPSFGSNCIAAVGASVVGQGLNGTTNGMNLGGSLLNAAVGVNLGFGGCTLSLTSSRVMNDAAGLYGITSSLSGDTLAGVNLGLLGGVTLSIDSYLQLQPGNVATATYNFPLITLLSTLNLNSPTVQVTTNGTDTLIQRVRLDFGGSALPILVGLTPSLLTSPSFTSAITADGAGVPEPGTLFLSSIGTALLLLSRIRLRARKQ